MRPKTRTEDYYKQFADDIITQIERGAAPWQKHWKAGENRMPENFSTGARYQGGNALQLLVKRTGRAYNDNRWGTYKQIKEAAGGRYGKANGAPRSWFTSLRGGPTAPKLPRARWPQTNRRIPMRKRQRGRCGNATPCSTSSRPTASHSPSGPRRLPNGRS